jgi:hypothetical protein
MPPFPIVLLPLTLPLGIVRVAFEEEAHVIRSIYILNGKMDSTISNGPIATNTPIPI